MPGTFDRIAQIAAVAGVLTIIGDLVEPSTGYDVLGIVQGNPLGWLKNRVGTNTASGPKYYVTNWQAVLFAVSGVLLVVARETSHPAAYAALAAFFLAFAIGALLTGAY